MGGLMKVNSEICPIDLDCSQWARDYMGYCLCTTRDGFSLALGLISVISWCVADIPQIITNYRQKSAHGLSVMFIVTWIIGDFFNLFGCLLEPATLPTQLYTAMFYSVNTLMLTTQSIYYGHLYPRLKSTKRRHESLPSEVAEKEHNYHIKIEQDNNLESSPIPLPSSSHNSPHGEDLYFMSARSLTVSHTPPIGSLPAPRTPTSDVEHPWLKEPLIGEERETRSTPTKTKHMLCVVFVMMFFVSGFNYQVTEIHENDMINGNPTGGIVLRVGRKLLQASKVSIQNKLGAESGGIGSFLGWGMAAIYMSGRLPQIWLNIRRGTAEGLNPFMFMFAVIGNTTYVASILISSLEWSKIKPNLPWLVDAGGCVLLDIFILIQFINFRRRSTKEVEKFAA